MNKYKKGFTILELLVVIAIIGILSAVVIGMVGNSRAKAADKAIIQDMASFKNQAELYAAANGSVYGNFNALNANATGTNDNCPNTAFSPTAVGTGLYQQSVFWDTRTGLSAPAFTLIGNNAIEHANLQSGGTATGTRYGNARCAANNVSWAGAVTLKTNNTKSWCVDSNGASKEVAGNAGSVNTVFTINAGGQIVCS